MSGSNHLEFWFREKKRPVHIQDSLPDSTMLISLKKNFEKIEKDWDFEAFSLLRCVSNFCWQIVSTIKHFVFNQS